MQPLIQDREVIVVDLSQKSLINDKIYVLQYKSKMWVKKYAEDKKTFISINPNFSHLVYKAEKVYIIGKVLDIRR